jgi:hypothetical protein
LFLGSYECDVLELLAIIMTNSSSTKYIPCEKLIAFSIFEFLLVLHERFCLLIRGKYPHLFFVETWVIKKVEGVGWAFGIIFEK